MARPTKLGLDYFPLDITFHENDKVQLINAEFGALGEVVLIRLLCKVYGTNGYWYKLGNDQIMLLAKAIGSGTDPGLVERIINALVRRSFFDEHIYSTHRILTSKSIQETFFKAVERRTFVQKIEEIILCDVNAYSNIVNVNINPVNAANSTQSIVKEIESKKEYVGGNSASLELPLTQDILKKVKEEQNKCDRSRGKFKIPTEEECLEYFSDKLKGKGFYPGLVMKGAQQFYFHYGANGWVKGKGEPVIWKIVANAWIQEKFEITVYEVNSHNDISFPANKGLDEKLNSSTIVIENELNYLYGRYLEGEFTPTLLKKEYVEYTKAQGLNGTIEAIFESAQAEGKELLFTTAPTPFNQLSL